MTEVTALVNGQPASSVNILDRGFQYGDGLFETIAVYRGKPLLWERHLARLVRGGERLGILLPAGDTLAAEAERLCSGAARAVLKLAITRGVGGRGYAAHGIDIATRVLYLSPWPDHPVAFAEDGVSLYACRTALARNPRLAGIKHLNRLEQVLARAEWRTEHADGIMCDVDGNVIEGTMSNVFIGDGQILRTPDVSACGVEGVMRAVVLEAAASQGLACHVERLTFADLERASEMFITNSLIGVWPVRQLREQEYSIGPVTRKIQEAVRQHHCFDRD